MICSTGNGCVSALGWIRECSLEYMAEEPNNGHDRNDMKLYRALNFVPPLGRGISWTLELDSFLELDWKYWRSYEKLTTGHDSEDERAVQAELEAELAELEKFTNK